MKLEVFAKDYRDSPSTAKVCCRSCGASGPYAEDDPPGQNYKEKAMLLWDKNRKETTGQRRGGERAKRYREPKPKPNTLELKWGKLRHDHPDILVIWGEGCAKADSRLLLSALTSRTYDPGTYNASPGLIEELKTRGYDIETIRFSIKKKP